MYIFALFFLYTSTFHGGYGMVNWYPLRTISHPLGGPGVFFLLFRYRIYGMKWTFTFDDNSYSMPYIASFIQISISKYACIPFRNHLAPKLEGPGIYVHSLLTKLFLHVKASFHHSLLRASQLSLYVPKWPLVVKVNPSKQGLNSKQKQGAPFGFQVYSDASKNLYSFSHNHGSVED